MQRLVCSYDHANFEYCGLKCFDVQNILEYDGQIYCEVDVTL